MREHPQVESDLWALYRIDVRERLELGRTWLRRPDLIDRDRLSKADRALLDAFLAERGGRGAPPEA